jgi:hypothetical protein
MKCIHCDRDATYDAPDDLCTKHWVEWWLDGMGLSKPEYYKERRRMIKEIIEQYGE